MMISTLLADHVVHFFSCVAIITLFTFHSVSSIMHTRYTPNGYWYYREHHANAHNIMHEIEVRSSSSFSTRSR